MDIAGIWNAYSAEAREPQSHTQKLPQHGVIRTSAQRTQSASSSTEPYYLPYFSHGPGRFTPSTTVPPQPTPSPPPVADAFTSMFDSTLERFQKEMFNLRDMCNNAFFKEQQETKRWKRNCDLVRERVKKLTAERKEYMMHAGDGSDNVNLNHRSPYHYRQQESRSHSPIPSISKRSSSRRSSSSTGSHSDAEEPPMSSSTSSSASSRRRSWDSRSPINDDSPSFRTTPSPISPISFPVDSAFLPDGSSSVLLPPPLLLPPAELDPLRRSHSTGPVLMSTPYCAAAAANVSAIPLQMDREADTANLLDNLRIQRQISLRPEHVDILYILVDGEFHCQACRINQSKATTSPLSQQAVAVPVAIFPGATDTIDLIDHYLRSHPKEAHDVAQLQPAGVAAVRQQLKRLGGQKRPYSSCPSSPCNKRSPLGSFASAASSSFGPVRG